MGISTILINMYSILTSYRKTFYFPICNKLCDVEQKFRLIMMGIHASTNISAFCILLSHFDGSAIGALLVIAQH